jgi:hypothetical protein
MVDDAVGDATHQGALERPEAPAAHDYQSRAQLFGDVHDLGVWTSDCGMGLCDLAAHLPYPLRKLCELRSGIALGALAQPVLELGVEELGLRARVDAWCVSHADDVQLQVQTVGERNRHPCGAFGIRGSISGQQHLVRERAHLFLLAGLTAVIL